MSTGNNLVLAQTVAGTSYLARAVNANQTFSGTSNTGLYKLFDNSAGTSGVIMTRLKARPIYAPGSTAFLATQAQLFKWDGANLIFDDDAQIPTQTLALSASTIPGDFGYSETAKRYLPPGWSWFVGIGVAWTPGVMFSGDVQGL